jgi:enoyl-CoA hydratase/carnithine racemase
MITLTIDGPIAVATLCRPPVNAINDEWVDRLCQVLDEVEQAPQVSVLWIRSAQKVFCAGADLALMHSILASADGRERMIDLTRRMQQVFARLEVLPKVTLAEISGPAMGGGLELALACDLRIVADSARIGLPETGLGLLPAAGGTQRMTRICGEATARRLILGAELVAGSDAVTLGLAQWSAPAAVLEQTARANVERIAALPARAIAECKACIAVALDGSADGFETELAGSAALLALPETQARVARFLEGRR